MDHIQGHISRKQHGFGLATKSCPLITVQQGSTNRVISACDTWIHRQFGEHILAELGVLLCKSSQAAPQDGNKKRNRKCFTHLRTLYWNAFFAFQIVLSG